MAITISFDWNVNESCLKNTRRVTNPQTGLAYVYDERVQSINLKSPVFHNDITNEDCSWYLQLTLNGSDDALKLYLARAELSNYYFSHIEVNLSTRDKILLISRSCKSIFNFQYNNKCNIDKFITMAVFRHFMAVGFELTISCKMYIEVEKCVFTAVPQQIPDYEKLLNDPEFSDFSIMTHGKEFKVHRNILTARSEVFSAMIRNEMREKKEGVMYITDFHDTVVEEFLRYLYCGRVRNLDRLADELLRLADKYSIHSLKIDCLEEICKKLSVENAFELLSLLDYYKVDHLKVVVVNFIVINYTKFDQTQIQSLANSMLSCEILLKVKKLLM